MTTDLHSVELIAEYAPATAVAIGRSLQLEVDPLRDARSETSIDIEDGEVTVRIGAADLVALRAAANTWCQLLQTAEAAWSAPDPQD